MIVLAPMSREARAAGRAAVVCPHAANIPPSVLRSGDDAPAAVLISGVCGALDPSLAPGALVLGRRVLTVDGRALEPASALFEAAQEALRRSRLPFVSSALLTVARPINERTAKTDAWNAHGAAAADMETYELAAALEARGVPWLALRAVLDPADMVLPRGAVRWTSEQDEGAIVRDMLRRPFELPAYARLALQLRAALRALSRAVPMIVRAIDASDALADRPARDAAAARIGAP